MGTFPASLELRNPCLPCVPWEPLAVGVGGEGSRGRGIKQIPGQTPSSGRYLESQKWRASRPLEENTGTRETAGRDRDRERDMRDMRAGRGEKLKGRGERGKRPSENGDPTQTAHAVTCHGLVQQKNHDFREHKKAGTQVTAGSGGRACVAEYQVNVPLAGRGSGCPGYRLQLWVPQEPPAQ